MHNSLFELSDMDINLEIFLNKPGKVEIVKEKVQKIFIAFIMFIHGQI